MHVLFFFFNVLFLKKTEPQYYHRVNKPVAIWEALAREEFSKPEMIFRVQTSREEYI